MHLFDNVSFGANFSAYTFLAEVVYQNENPWKISADFKLKEPAPQGLKNLEDDKQSFYQINQYPPMFGLLAVFSKYFFTFKSNLAFQGEYEYYYIFNIVIFCISIILLPKLIVTISPGIGNSEFLFRLVSLVTLFSIQPLIIRSWFTNPAGAEDKIIILFFILLSLIFYQKLKLSVFVATLFSCIKIIGFLIFPYLMIFHLVIKKEKMSSIIIIYLLSFSIFCSSFLLWFPLSMQGLLIRIFQSVREATHSSLFVLIPEIYTPSLPLILTVVACIIFVGLYRKKIITFFDAYIYFLFFFFTVQELNNYDRMLLPIVLLFLNLKNKILHVVFHIILIFLYLGLILDMNTNRDGNIIHKVSMMILYFSSFSMFFLSVIEKTKFEIYFSANSKS